MVCLLAALLSTFVSLKDTHHPYFSALRGEKCIFTSKSNFERKALFAVSDELNDRSITPPKQTQIYFDVAVDTKEKKQPIGRLVFNIPSIVKETYFPRHVENIIQLVTEKYISINPRCTYVGCEFMFTQQCIEGLAQYRWSHTLNGHGINAITLMEPTREKKEIFESEESLRSCINSIYGGTYYGLNLEDIAVTTEESLKFPRVVLTVPLTGPGRGLTSLSIVRVDESPREWKDTLLLNSAVLGFLDVESLDCLKIMARQRLGPPVVAASGVLP